MQEEQKAEKDFAHNLKLISLKGRLNFLAVLTNGKRFFLPNLVLRYHKNEVNRLRLGIIASRKVGNAVKRNKIKRKIKEYFRKLFAENPNLHYDFIITIKANYPLDYLKYQEDELNKILLKVLKISKK